MLEAQGEAGGRGLDLEHGSRTPDRRERGAFVPDGDQSRHGKDLVPPCDLPGSAVEPIRADVDGHWVHARHRHWWRSFPAVSVRRGGHKGGRTTVRFPVSTLDRTEVLCQESSGG